MKKLLTITALLIVLLFAVPVWCADLAVSPSGAGTKDGSDWDNAADWSTMTFTRGNTYYLADGTYAAKTLNTAESGTTLITILKATVAAHGPATGWADSMGDGQAVWSADLGNYGSYVDFNSGYWVFDGVTGSGSTTTSYGFAMTPSVCQANRLIGSPGTGHATGVNPTNVTVSHTAFVNCGSGTDTHQVAVYTFPETSSGSMTISNNYFAGSAVNIALIKSSNTTITDNWFNSNWSSATNHGEQISLRYCDDVILKNNYFVGSTVYVMGAHTANNHRALIYNNVVNGGSLTAIWGNADSGTSDIIESWQIHHNTHIGVTGAAILVGTLTDVDNQKSYAYNNLFYNCTNPIMSNAGYTAGGIVHNYNAYIDSTGYTDETNKQTGTGDPFTDSAGGDYTLKSGTVPIDHGTTLAATYDDDKAGVTRPQGAAWDMGAYEYEAPAGSWIVTFTTTAPCTEPAAVAVANGATGEGTLTVPNGYRHGTTSSGTWSGNAVTTAAITADITVTLGCETIKIGGVR